MNVAVTCTPTLSVCESDDLSPEANAVRQALLERGLETPLLPSGLSTEQRYDRIRSAFEDIMEALGLDLSDDSLVETPHRVAKMYLEEVFAGLDYRRFPKITQISNRMQVEEMVRVDGISVSSTCEHHFVTIDGTARVA
jgi:GTP cyclohydrolase I